MLYSYIQPILLFLITTLLALAINGILGFRKEQEKVVEDRIQKEVEKDKKVAKTNDLIIEGLKALLHAQIIKDGEQILAKDIITENDIHELKLLFKPYSSFNGNGTAKAIVARAEQRYIERCAAN
ncbi:hypothetical protein [Clostridium sp.]|uniref:hypothetical protein n=1 Tax=Clostridium sp. TaxID=1506 RepID=UPI001A381468|nr:hypothetical protein [Clostridium sp.]MBK5234063.1 hypothetical protein [Clostridium sp.]